MTRRAVLVAVLVAACLLFVVFWGRADTPTPAPHPSSCPPGTVRLLIAHDRVATAGMHAGLIGDRKGLLVELSRLPALPSLRGCGK